MKSFRLIVDGMKCEGCAKTVKEAIESLEKGKIKCDVNLGSKEVVVTLEDDSEINLEKIEESIISAGYTPKREQDFPFK